MCLCVCLACRLSFFLTLFATDMNDDSESDDNNQAVVLGIVISACAVLFIAVAFFAHRSRKESIDRRRQNSYAKELYPEGKCTELNPMREV